MRNSNYAVLFTLIVSRKKSNIFFFDLLHFSEVAGSISQEPRRKI